MGSKLHMLILVKGDDIALTNAHFRKSMAEADFAAVRRNREARAAMSDKDHVIGIVAETE